MHCSPNESNAKHARDILLTSSHPPRYATIQGYSPAGNWPCLEAGVDFIPAEGRIAEGEFHAGPSLPPASLKPPAKTSIVRSARANASLVSPQYAGLCGPPPESMEFLAPVALCAPLASPWFEFLTNTNMEAVVDGPNFNCFRSSFSPSAVRRTIANCCFDRCSSRRPVPTIGDAQPTVRWCPANKRAKATKESIGFLV